MKKNRLYYTCLLIGMIVYNIIHYTYFSIMLLYTLIIIPIMCLLHIYLTYLCFKFTHSVDERVIIKGDVVNYQCEIINDNKFIVFCPMRIHLSHERLFFKEHHKSSYFTLFPGQSKVIKMPIECKYRGSYRLGVDKLYIMDFFGLIKIPYALIESIKMLVYPNVEPLSYFPMQPIIYENTKSTDHSIMGDKNNLHDIRAYQSGDTLAQIHWKLTAKNGTIMAKNYRSTIQNKVMVFLDTRKLPFEEEKNIITEDLLVESVVSVIYHLLGKGKPVHLVYEEREVCNYIGQNLSDWHKIYEALAKLQFIGRYEMKDLMHESLALTGSAALYGITIIIAIQYVSNSLYGLLMQLTLQGYEIILLTAMTSSNVASDLMNDLSEQGIKVYPLSNERTLQSVIEGVYHVS